MVAVACAAVPLGFLTDRFRDVAILIANLLQLGLPAALVTDVVLVGLALFLGAWRLLRERRSAWATALTVLGPPFAVVMIAGLLVAVLVAFVNLAGVMGQPP